MHRGSVGLFENVWYLHKKNQGYNPDGHQQLSWEYGIDFSDKTYNKQTIKPRHTRDTSVTRVLHSSG